MELLRTGNFGALNASRGGRAGVPRLLAPGAQPSAVTGAFQLPVIAIAYKDIGVPYPIADYQCVLFSQTPGGCAPPGDRPYSVATFYEEMAHHRISMNGVVFAPVTQDSVAVFYTDGCKGLTISGRTNCPRPPSQNRMAAMLVATLDSISNRPGGLTVWSEFDNDGPDGVSNSGDDDGVVDFVTFLQPEVGGECVSTTTTGIWSHRYVISGWTGQMYTTKTPRRGSNGQPIPGQFLKVNDYTIQSEVGGVSSCDGSNIMGIGTVAHETGHAFGLPDLYDTSGSTEGIGGWGLMGSGNYARPYSPSSYDAWSLHALGWATVDTLVSSRTVVAGPRLVSDTIFYARTNNPDEYLLVENRQAVLSDTAQMNPTLSSTCPLPGLGFCAKSPGLLFWLINQTKASAGGFGNSVNAGFPHGVSLLQADGLNQLRTPGLKNRGDRGDAYPGTSNNTGLTLLSAPGARDNVGEYLGFTVDRIEPLAVGNLRFRFNRRAPSLVQGGNGAQIRVNGIGWNRYEEVVPAGDLLQIGADPVQSLSAGKTRATFLSWSNGGPREQTVVSGTTKPDSVLASFSLEHRLVAVASGGGTITATVTGDLSQGVFLAVLTPATLTARGLPGFTFAGWRGDTVATAAALGLTMRKGYDLEARFVATVPVDSEDAVNDLLGIPSLTDAQRSFLDELGNRNGAMDAGDILAMFHRAGQAVPPAVLQAAVARPGKAPDQ
jgi:M6 family metalloprotease-like protein